MRAKSGVRWTFGRFLVGRTVHRALVWNGKREDALVVHTTSYGFWHRQAWHWE